MEDHIVKSQKSFAVRGTLALVAAGSALTFTACSAGQITQTGSQVAAVNGVSGSQGFATVSGAAVVVGPDDGLEMKFTAGNLADNKAPIRLESVEVEGKQVSGIPVQEIKPGCNIVADKNGNVKDMENAARESTCNIYASTDIPGLKDVYLGGHKKVTFTFSNGTIELNAPVVAFTPPSGKLYRLDDGQFVDQKDYHTGADENAGHGGSH